MNKVLKFDEFINESKTEASEILQGYQDVVNSIKTWKLITPIKYNVFDKAFYIEFLTERGTEIKLWVSTETLKASFISSKNKDEISIESPIELVKIIKSLNL